MMNQRDGVQGKLVFVNLEQLMPAEHFLRDLERAIDFNFIYEKVQHLYSKQGRRSIDPVLIVKMLLLGYIYGIESERRLEQEVQLNIAYRWFLGIDLDDAVPDHSTFSQLRRRKFQGSSIFEDIFTHIVEQCIDQGFIDGKLLLTDSTHVKADVNDEQQIRLTVEDTPSNFLRRMDEEAKKDGIYPKERKPRPKKEKEILKNPTDMDAGFMKRIGKPLGFYYLSHQTCDSLHGLITDVHVTAGNELDATVHSERIRYQIDRFAFPTEGVCADAGYDFTEIHKDMLDRNIKTYIPKRVTRADQDSGFIYDMKTDSLICPNNEILHLSQYRKQSGCKRYTTKEAQCANCTLREQCISQKGKIKAVERAYFKYASELQHKNTDGTPAYYDAMRLRKIYCEGNFSHQKRNHNLRRMRMRGLGRAYEQCLLSACALNLKRMVKLIKYHLLQHEIPLYGYYLCQKSNLQLVF